MTQTMGVTIWHLSRRSYLVLSNSERYFSLLSRLKKDLRGQVDSCFG